tara:strand:+ start:11914 stop:12018 length:105 start_codon:yes stop_codon:yes gene_type:complete
LFFHGSDLEEKIPQKIENSIKICEAFEAEKVLYQ